MYSKTCLQRPLKRRPKLVFKTDYHLMQVRSIAECSFIKLPFVFTVKTFVLSVFDRFYWFVSALVYRHVRNNEDTKRRFCCQATV